MSPFNAPQNNNSRNSNEEPSSSSTTPPSETTLNDYIVSEAGPAAKGQKTRAAVSFDADKLSQEPPADNLRAKMVDAINTDYESSAAEDFESFSSSSKYENAECAFLSYSRTNKLEKLRALLEAKLKDETELNLNYRGQQKQNFSWSALHLACYFGHIEVVEQILSKKRFREEIDINIQNNSGDTPLHKATLTNRARIVQLLLSNGANVFLKNCDGLFAKQLTNDKHILDMLGAAEQVDKNRIKQEMFKAVDNGDLKKLQEFFESYGSCLETSRNANGVDNVDVIENNQSGSSNHQGDTARVNGNITHNDLISSMIDERGNTLLHLATMRSFKAICVYLLEQGLDPYKKNNLGQTCIDLASYQLRQLFMTVKPANSQLKKLSNQRVTRFEGPLLKKVRILGWKQIYVVLENGVILLFNNRRDSMNKARRGYKYLESATCEPDLNDIGTFTVCFSDKSRATFLVTSDHLNNYTSFKFSNMDSEKPVTPGSQVELVRQKWIDSIRDHIKYSTDFIKNGLKFNDYDDDNEIYREGDITTMNHLLPVDTIKSFMQEARAHYSILQRHAESLCNLVQSISASSRSSQSIESTIRDDDSQMAETPTVAPSSITGSRLLGFIRPARVARGSSTSGEEALASQSPQTNRRRNNSLTNEFVQDNWHCILFHLRLLIESTENTKTSMSQALTLMEHQEQLRQNRIQDQDERCRVLEDSLHALARDHHELEKSISVSQIYHSAAAARSVSMSTDLNEYFDAFEDFDDEKTMTPNSMPSDEDLNRKIQDVMNEEEIEVGAPSMKVLDGGECSYGSNRLHRMGGSEDYEDEEDDDMRSNCSALTVETTSEQCAGSLDPRRGVLVAAEGYAHR